jgi:hypothetical protein
MHHNASLNAKLEVASITWGGVSVQADFAPRTFDTILVVTTWVRSLTGIW